MAGRYAGSVAKAVPICMGDYFKSFRVVGTNAAYFDTLALGDTFAPTHGADDGLVHDPFTITGILARTDTPVDRGVYVNMEGFYLHEGHAKSVPDDEQPPEAGGEAGGALEISRPQADQSPRLIREISQATEAFTPADPPPADPQADDTSTANEAGGEAGGALEISRPQANQSPRPIREISQATKAFTPADASPEDQPAEPPGPTPLPFNQREVTAILVQTASPAGCPRNCWRWA